MSLPEFGFALHVSDARQFDTLLGDVASGILRSTGLGEAQLAELTRALGAAAAAGPCDVDFRAAGGQLRITVTAAGKPATHFSYAIP